MQHSRNRLMAMSGATLALALAGTAAVAAHGPGDDERGFAFGRDARGGGPFRDAMGMFEARGLRGMALEGMAEDFQRRETTLQTADGTQTIRVDNGTVSSVGDTGLDYALASGETASVTTDEDTAVYALTEQSLEMDRRGFSIERLVPTEIELADIQAGTDVLVWSGSEDGGAFVAERILVQPAVDAEDATEDAATTEGDAAAAEEEAPASPVADA